MSYYNSNFEEELEEMLQSYKYDPQRQVHKRHFSNALYENILTYNQDLDYTMKDFDNKIL